MQFPHLLIVIFCFLFGLGFRVYHRLKFSLSVLILCISATKNSDIIASKETPMPICSLPMLNGYIYVINDSALISAAMRNRNSSVDPFTLEFATGSMGMTQR